MTRYANGQPTRFTFKKPFPRTPNLQLTPILHNRPGTFQNFYIYLLNPSGGPPVDKDGFYVGMFSNPGVSVDFEYFATDIFEDNEAEVADQ